MSNQRKPRAAAPAVAHDILVASSFRDHPVRTGVATAVTLRFNAKIELSLSKVLLLTAGGKARVLEIRLAPPASRMAGLGAVAAMLMIGLLLTFYKEPVG